MSGAASLKRSKDRPPQPRRALFSAPDTPTEPRTSRTSAGHTQAQAAELISVARRTWQDWERGVAQIPPAMLRLYRHLAGLERIPFRGQTT